MSLSVGGAHAGIYAAPVPPAAKPGAAVAAAQQALARADGVVEEDERDHSPGCVACDQKLVDKARAQLTRAKAEAANDQSAQAPSPPGSTVDITA